MVVGPDFKDKIAAPANQILTKLPRIEILMGLHHIQDKIQMKRVRWPVVLTEWVQQAMDLKQESMLDRISDTLLALLAISAETSKTFRCHKKIKNLHELAYNSLLKNLK